MIIPIELPKIGEQIVNGLLIESYSCTIPLAANLALHISRRKYAERDGSWLHSPANRIRSFDQWPKRT